MVRGWLGVAAPRKTGYFPMGMGFSFGRASRLTRRRDIERLLREGKRLEGRAFSFRVLAKDDPNPRLLVVASRKVGGAVIRNRVKRGIREGFRQNKGLFAGLDVAVIAHPQAGKLSPGEIARRWIAEFQEVNDGTGDPPHQGGVRAQESGAGEA